MLKINVCLFVPSVKLQTRSPGNVLTKIMRQIYIYTDGLQYIHCTCLKLEQFKHDLIFGVKSLFMGACSIKQREGLASGHFSKVY